MSARELDLYEHVAAVAGSMPTQSFTKPDDDWAPMAFFETDEEESPAIMPLGDFMNSDASKDLLADFILPQVIKRMRAKKVVIVLSTWQVRLDKGVELGDLMPSQHPARTEALMLTEYTGKGIGRYATAEIIRHKSSPPTLGEWSSLETEVASIEGRFVDSIVKALKSI